MLFSVPQLLRYLPKDDLLQQKHKQPQQQQAGFVHYGGFLHIIISASITTSVWFESPHERATE